MMYQLLNEEEQRNRQAEITMLEEMVAEAERSRALNHAAATIAIEQRDNLRACLQNMKGWILANAKTSAHDILKSIDSALS